MSASKESKTAKTVAKHSDKHTAPKQMEALQSDLKRVRGKTHRLSYVAGLPRCGSSSALWPRFSWRKWLVAKQRSSLLT